MPTAYEGDQMTMARQLREMNVDFKGVYFVYASQPQFLAIGKDAQYHFSQTLLNDRINWKVTGGLNRAQMMERYAKLFPSAQYPADFQTALAYGAGAVLEQIIQEAQSVDAAKLKEAALKLNNKIITVTGPYEIDETGKQFKNEFAVMQNMPNGVEVVYPADIATAKAVYPVPPYKDRK
jgi:branched-chain amino acid transport system substrate-binding protein